MNRKRSLKKLTLTRETISKLNEERLAAAAGGSGDTCSPTCNTMCFVCPPSNICPSFQTNCSFCASDCDTCKDC